MRSAGLDVSDCFDCPMLAGLTDEQKHERIRTDPLIRKCLAARRAGATVKRRAAAATDCRFPSIDNAQGAEPLVD